MVRSTSLRPRFLSLDACLSQQNQGAEERKALVTGLVRVAPIKKRRLGRLGLGDYQKSDIQIWQNFQVGKYIKHEVWLNRFPEGFRHLPGSSQLLASGHGTIWKLKLLFLLRSELGFLPTIFGRDFIGLIDMDSIPSYPKMSVYLWLYLLSILYPYLCLFLSLHLSLSLTLHRSIHLYCSIFNSKALASQLNLCQSLPGPQQQIRGSNFSDFGETLIM